MGKKLANKVLLIGWDAADWKVIEPLMQQGKMPALQKLMQRGVYGRLQTLDPPLSPMLWTSIATGFRADKHGIKGFIEPLEDGSGLRPVTSTSRKVKAIWNILNQSGYRSNVVGWWPSNPVEPINGVMVSNLYQQFTKQINEDNPMPPGTVHPDSMKDELETLRVHPEEISLSMLLPFVPNAANDEELRKEKRLQSVAKVLAHAASIHAASTHVLENTEWDFMAIYHDAIDHFSHLCMKFHPPYREGYRKEDFENYKGVVEAGYRFHDMMLERTMDLVDDDTTIILVSDHGFHPDHQRPLQIPKEPSGPAIEHSPYGIMVMAGPGIKHDPEPINGSKVIDITPTLLPLFGLPVGKDMEGRVLAQVYSEEITPDFIDSWENVPGNAGMHDKEIQEDPWAAQEAMQQLVELGYIEKLDDDKLGKVDKAVRESQYYLARNLIDGGKMKEAIEILEKIFEESNVGRYGQRLANAYLSTKRYKLFEELLPKLRIAEEEEFKRNKEESAKKAEEEKKKDPFENREFEEPLYIDFLEGMYLLALNKPLKALPFLERVLAMNPHNVQVANSIGRIMNLRKRFDEAEKYFLHALSIDDRSSAAHHGLGLSHLRRGNVDIALSEFLDAVHSNYYNFNAHYHLGECLVKKGLYENAAEAFEVVVRLEPGMSKAHRWLQELYSKELASPEKAKEHEKFISENIQADIVIVSGLPRSGTSMMMQMLDAGGVPILSDAKREADNSNPKGYLEFEPVKSLHINKSWVKDAQGKAVKVIAQLVPHLPSDFKYKVIFMERDLNEVIVSQQKMLGKPVNKDAVPMSLYSAFQKQLEKVNIWIDAQPNVQVLSIPHKGVIENPAEQAAIVADFLGMDLDTDKMAAAVDPSLHRNKVEK